MSIHTHIAVLEVAGKLRRYVPKSRYSPKRRLYLTEKAVKDLESPDSVINLLAIRGQVEEGLKRWVSGGRVWVDLQGKPRFLKPLCPPPSETPPEIWELRFTDPRVQARLFLRFAEPDTIIGTKFHTRKLLGDRGSPEWKAAFRECETSWNELFPGFTPFSGKTIHDYVTENCDDFPLCS